MTGAYRIDLHEFPPLHRIVKSWYSRQELYLRKMGGPVPQSNFAATEDNQESD